MLGKMLDAISWRLCRLISKIPDPPYTFLKSRAVFNWMNENAVGKQILNLGSGLGNFDGLLNSEIKMINADIDPEKPNLDYVCDAMDMPFEDESFDIVYSIAVLEHVPKPWVAAKEIQRVLKPGGHVVLILPFLNIVHSNHDYFRYTDMGIRSLFDDDSFDVLLSESSVGGGSFLSAFLTVYPLQFIPTEVLRCLWHKIMFYPFSLLRFLDMLNFSSRNSRTPEDGFKIREMRTTACSFSFIAQKKNSHTE